jgi:hypothetical protein
MAWRNGPVLCAVLVLAAAGAMGLLSIIFNFTSGSLPSVDYPYFTSSRWVLGAVIPFMICFVGGFERLFPRFLRGFIPFLFLLLFFAWITWTEASVSGGVFKSPYNLFNLS